MGKIITKKIHLNPNKIEVQHHEADSKLYALLISPDPKNGSTMYNKISTIIFKAFVESNWNVLRFNFRNVGSSTGRVDDDSKYTLVDTNRVLDWYIDKANDSMDRLVIAGYEYGSLLAMETLMRRPEIHNFITVGLPVHLNDFTFLAPCPCPGLVIHGEFDNISTTDKINELIERISQQQPDIEYKLIPDDHHFSSTIANIQNSELEKILKKYISEISTQSGEKIDKNTLNAYIKAKLGD